MSRQAHYQNKPFDLSYQLCDTHHVIRPTNELQGHDFSIRTGLTPSTVKKSADDLQKMDLIFLDQAGYYQVLDPVIAYFIRQHA